MSINLVMAAYGGGTNSAALIVKWLADGNQLDVILFADTGGEKPHTYEYVGYFSNWLNEKYGKEIITVKSNGKSLYQAALIVTRYHHWLTALKHAASDGN